MSNRNTLDLILSKPSGSSGGSTNNYGANSVSELTLAEMHLFRLTKEYFERRLDDGKKFLLSRIDQSFHKLQLQLEQLKDNVDQKEVSFKKVESLVSQLRQEFQTIEFQNKSLGGEDFNSIKNHHNRSNDLYHLRDDTSEEDIESTPEKNSPSNSTEVMEEELDDQDQIRDLWASELLVSLQQNCDNGELENPRQPTKRKANVLSPVSSEPSTPPLKKQKTEQGSRSSGRNILSRVGTRKRRGHLPEEATSLLKNWLWQHNSHPYPSEDEKQGLSNQTGLTLTQINNWFTNARRRILKKQFLKIKDPI